MMLLVLSVALTYVSGAAVTETPTRCGWGPPFWCSSLDHARECQATKHCLDTVWKYQTLQEDSVETCTYCQMVVGELKELLAEKSTQDFIGDEAAKACSLLPNPDWKDQCKGIVLEYAPEIIAMVDNDIDAYMMCATVGLCAGLEDRVSPYGGKATTPPTTPAPSPSVCQDCTRFFVDVQKSITSNETIDSLMQLFNQTLCSKLGSFQDICMEVLRDNLPFVLQVLADELDPNVVCRVFGFCTSDKLNPAEIQIKLNNVFKDNRKEPMQYRSSEECDACKEIVGQIESVLRDRTMQQKIINFMETEVCGALGDLSAQCKQVVEEYGPLVFELLVNEFDPTTVCESLGICPIPTLYGVKPVGMEMPMSKVEQGHLGSEECDLCMDIVGEIDSLLKANDTQRIVETVLERICDKLPTKALEDQCTNYVKTYTPLVIYLLSQDLDPKSICTSFKFCPATTLQDKKAMDDTICDICVDVVKEVELLVANMTADELVGIGMVVCSYIPVPQYQQTCETYVKQYVPFVLDFLKESDPKSICELAGACNASANGRVLIRTWSKMTKPIPEDLSQSSVKAGPSITCELCGTIIEYAKALFENKATEEEIIAKLESYCTVFGPYADECKSLIETEGPNIYQMLVDDLQANVICNKLGLCTSSTQLAEIVSPVLLSPASTLPLGDNVNAGPSITCEVCDTIIVYAKALLANKATEEEIIKELESFCTNLGPFADECKTLIETEGHNIYDMLVKDLDANEICQKLGLCKGSVKAGPSITCEVCDTIIVYAKALLASKATEEEIIKELESFCTNLGPFADECKTLIETEGHNIYDMLVKDLDANEICQKLGLCKGSVKAGPSITCEVCDTIIVYAKTLLANKATEEEIIKELESYCTNLGPFADECKALIETEGHNIYDMLVQELDANEICQKLGLCKGNVKAGPSTACEVCDTVVIYAKTLLGNKETEDEIISELESLCSELGSYAEECKLLIESEGKNIYAALLKFLDANAICAELGLCKSSNKLGNTISAPTAILSPVETLPLVGKETAAVDKCTVCSELMSALKTIIGSQVVVTGITAALEYACNDLEPRLQGECDKLVLEYGPKILGYLQADLDDVCKELDLCPSKLRLLQQVSAASAGIMSPVDTLPLVGVEEKKEDKSGNTENCEVCKQLATVAIRYIGSEKTEDRIQAELAKACNDLPSLLVGECTSLVDTYAKVAINWALLEWSVDEICQALEMCPAVAMVTAPEVPEKTLLEPVHVKLLKDDSYDRLEVGEWKADVKILPPATSQTDPNGGPLCTICEFVLREVKNIMGENSSEASVKNALEKVCDVMPSTITKECTTFIDEYFDLVYKLLINGVDPGEVCGKINLCTQAMVTVKAGPECLICEFVLNTVKQFLNENSSEAEIENVLKDICMKMPTTISMECADFVSTYGPLVISLLKKEVDPDTICKNIKLCSGSKQMAVKNTMHKATSKTDQNGGPLCTICEFVLREVKNIMGENSSEASVKNALEKVCDVMPSTLTKECTTFIDEYFDLVYKLLINGVDPDEVCGKINLCTQVMVTVKAGPECLICEFVLNTVKQFLNENSSEAEIENVLKDICMKMPTTISMECADFVSTYGPLVISLLKKEVDPDTICKNIKLCSGSKQMAVKNTMHKGMVNMKAGPECILCEFVLNTVKQFLDENSTAAEIEDVLKDICTKLPATISMECADFVSTYGPLVISLLQKEVDPDTICKNIKLCTGAEQNSKQKVSIEGLPANWECTVCEYVLMTLDSVLEQNSTEEEIRKALDEVCGLMPESVMAQCDYFVNTYGSIVERYLANLVSPNVVCTLIGVCKSNQKSVPMLKPKAHLTVPQTSSLECEMCKLVSASIETYLHQGKSEAEIKYLLYELCSQLPDTVTVQCRAFMDKYAPEILADLQKQMDPDTICPALQLCDKKTAVPTSKPANDDTLYFHPRGGQHLLGANKCTQGPAFWCANEENARSCNAMEHCKRHVWN